MNNRTKRTLISLAVIILLVIIVIVIIRINKEEKLADDPTDRDIMPEELIEYIDTSTGKIIKVENFGDIITVSACLGRFYDNYYSSDKNDETREKVYYMLSDEYKEKYNIDIEEIDSDIEYEELKVEIYEMYFVTNYEGMNLYFVNGLVRDRNYDSVEFNNIVVLDKNTSSFEVYLDDYLKDNNIDINNIVLESEYPLPQIVERNQYNSYSTSTTTMEDYASYLFTNMKKAIVYDTDYVADMLYESSELKNAIGLKEFYENNKRAILLAAYSTYEIENVDGQKVINCYSKDDTICFRFYMDSYSKFKFDVFLI